jgi:hypothetical protein
LHVGPRQSLDHSRERVSFVRIANIEEAFSRSWTVDLHLLRHGITREREVRDAGCRIRGARATAHFARDSTASSLHDWGWVNGASWLSQPATVTFGSTGPHTLRVQIREDGVELDQIVLSPSRYRVAAPGTRNAAIV